MKWEKKGRIFVPNGQYEFMNTHTTPLNAVVLEDKIRIFFRQEVKKTVMEIIYHILAI